VDVFIESRSGDYFVVHDAGKAANELILQGVNLTPSIENNCHKLAERFSAQWSEEMFQVRCKIEHLNAAILGIAMCSSLATVFLLDHTADTGEDEIREQFGAALKTWSKKRARVKERVLIAGQWKQHNFDFVAYPKNAEPIAISVLAPSGSSISVADRAAFRARDLEETPFSKWRRVIVETRCESWTGPAKNLLAKCCDLVIEIPSGDVPQPEMIAASLGQFLEAA
jgi:hypothetical protein